MMDNLDKKLRDNAESKLPKNIDDVIENTLNSLENKPKKRKSKKALIAASLSAVLLGGVGFGVTASAKNMSVTELVYNILGYDKEEDILTGIYKEQEKDGITFKIEKAGYYADQFVVSYVIKSKEYVDYLKSRNEDNLYAVPRFLYEGKHIDSGISAGSDIISEDEVVGTFETGIKTLEEIKNSENNQVKLMVEVYTADRVFTEFEVDVPIVDEMEIKAQTFKFENKIIGENNKYGLLPSKLEQLVVGPYKIVLTYKDEYIEGMSDEELDEIVNERSNNGVELDKDIEYLIFDDKGREVVFENGGGITSKMEMNYIPNENMKKLYLVPQIWGHFKEEYQKIIDVTIKDGKLSVQGNEDFELRTEEHEEFTRVYAKGKVPYIVDFPWFTVSTSSSDINGDGKETDEDNEVVEWKETSFNSAYYDIPKDLKDGSYIFEYQDLNRFELLEDEIIEIDLTK